MSDSSEGNRDGSSDFAAPNGERWAAAHPETHEKLPPAVALESTVPATSNGASDLTLEHAVGDGPVASPKPVRGPTSSAPFGRRRVRRP
jgi:hypothetical protein